MNTTENVEELLALNDREGRTTHAVLMSLSSFLQYLAEREVHVPPDTGDEAPFGYICGYPIKVIGRPGYYVEVV